MKRCKTSLELFWVSFRFLALLHALNFTTYLIGGETEYKFCNGKGRQYTNFEFIIWNVL